MLASDWSRESHDRKCPEMTSGPEVGGETADQGKKGIVGSGNRKSRVLGGETADQREKRIVGSGWGKTAEKRGCKVQSPILASGVVL